MNQDEKSTSRQGHIQDRIIFSRLKLKVIEGPDKGREAGWEKGSVFTVGRGSRADFRLSDNQISRIHMSIEPHRHGVLLCDKGSQNGTYINKLPIQQVSLKSGSRIEIGNTVLAFAIDNEEIDLTKPPTSENLGLVGSSESISKVRRMIEEYARLGSHVLIMGETGTGKELVAEAIHRLSGRSGPLVRFSGAAASTSTFDSELFGHVRGAFTGAERDRIGAFKEAEEGTLFLDEIDRIPLDLQPRLLHALDRREVKPLGSDDWFRVSVRILTATNKNLTQQVEEGKFHLDLFSRLSVLPLPVPPLREHLEDLPELIAHFTSEPDDQPCKIDPEALEILEHHDWPGNVRELMHVMERCIAVKKPETLDAQSVKQALEAFQLPWEPGQNNRETPVSLKDIEIKHIQETLDKTGGSRRKTAKLLGISEAALYAKIKRF
ncbi:sigma 54-interacting transcriptional regulator, partial [Acidobacteriota bacterium]